MILYHLCIIAGQVKGFVHRLVELIFEVGCRLQTADGGQSDWL